MLMEYYAEVSKISVQRKNEHNHEGGLKYQWDVIMLQCYF